jgi:hypothetical protein
MSARVNLGGSPEPGAANHLPARGGALGSLRIVLLVLVFVAALGGSFVLLRGRLGSAAPPTPVPTAVVIATPALANSAPTAGPAAANPDGRPTASTQPTLTADQAQAAYLWQQSHEEDFCSCNTTNPPSSP